ncbi:undecaprenyl-diphosphate phosphatase [Desulforhopalus vacuolatus]|uniref:undecaprenyl-diphosphate phosphatase n=1 Tax=Desulforhopalus vacuolatus TaxID=40414 RepID=UPI001964077F|nr:undecaprenyl-diphosphate phosphatase [Desulforhopalus vacuolatus]MBM9521015.1 undecaprenyl-diphosphate phosphatase [Desulforhopalus vacuolatus]
MWLTAIILGIIEGLTEFLPVSSTGHLIIANMYYGFEGRFEAMFDIVIQFGAILAVVVFFRREIFPSFRGDREKEHEDLLQKITLWKKIIFGFIPAVVLGVFLNEFLEKYLFNPKSVALALIVGAVLMVAAEKRAGKPFVKDSDHITMKQALIVGFFQCLAMWPGMSRSASTIAGGMFCGLTRTVSAEFSFFLGIPTIMGASVYKLLKTGLDYNAAEWGALAVGTVVSFIVALVVIKFFMEWLKKHGLIPFAVYRVLLGAAILLFVH